MAESENGRDGEDALDDLIELATIVCQAYPDAEALASLSRAELERHTLNLCSVIRRLLAAL